MFYFDNINGKKVLKSTLLNGLEHFFTTKESLIKTKEADYEKQAAQNRKEICEYLKINEEDFIHPKQTHSANIELLTHKIEYPDTDALIVNSDDKAVYLSFADCTPIVLYDSKNNAAAVVHAGWRSSAQKIAPKTVEKMQKYCGSSPKDIKAAIFPCICFKCFETGYEVIEALAQTVKNKKGLFLGRYADLKEVNARQLKEAGVNKIDTAPYCTYCNNDLFFSYRKENKTTNRNSLIVKLTS